MSDSVKSSADDEDGKPNDKVHTDIKPEFKERPGQYPATRDGGDNVDSPAVRKND